ncbi:hypothetical protein [Streptomyces sp. NPDC086023]|uniref:hypothetical protein n=1 Tax=Streptomyces sp. NPDC086023 TaxID=3365746 RepID=UPI0037D33C8A
MLRPAGPGVVTGPGGEPWQVYVVRADADRLGKAPAAGGDACCAGREEGAPAA